MTDAKAIVSKCQKENHFRISQRSQRSIGCYRQRLAQSSRHAKRLDETLGYSETWSHATLSKSAVESLSFSFIHESTIKC